VEPQQSRHLWLTAADRCRDLTLAESGCVSYSDGRHETCSPESAEVVRRGRIESQTLGDVQD